MLGKKSLEYSVRLTNSSMTRNHSVHTFQKCCVATRDEEKLGATEVVPKGGGLEQGPMLSLNPEPDQFGI